MYDRLFFGPQVDQADVVDTVDGLEMVNFLIADELSKPYSEVDWFWLEQLVWEQVAVIRGHCISNAVYLEFQRLQVLDDQLNEIPEDVRAMSQPV